MVVDVLQNRRCMVFVGAADARHMIVARAEAECCV